MDIELGPEMLEALRPHYSNARFAFDEERMSRRERRQNPRSNAGALFTPASLPGLVLWLRADRGIVLAGSGVGTWNDQSSAGNNVTQGTDANRPTYSATGAPNNLPSLAFSGSQWLLGTSAPFASATAWTIFAVLKAADLSAQRVAYNCGNTGSGIALGVDGNAHNERDIVLQGVQFQGDSNGSGTTNWEAWTAYGNSTPAQSLRVNGAARFTNIAGSPANPAAAQAVGAAVAATSQWSGQVAEVFAYSATLSLGQIAQGEQYLRTRYAIW